MKIKEQYAIAILIGVSFLFLFLFYLFIQDNRKLSIPTSVEVNLEKNLLTVK